MERTTRDSSALALQQLTQLQATRMQQRAQERAAVAASQAHAQRTQRMRTEKLTQLRLVRTQLEAEKVPERNTVERIQDLRLELGQARADRQAILASMGVRVAALEESLLRSPGGAAFSLAASSAAAIATLGVLSSSPQLASPDAMIPTRVGATEVDTSIVLHMPQHLPSASATSAPGAAMAIVVDRAALEPPMPRARPTAKRQARPVPRARVAPRLAPTPESDPLASIANCGDDPICGLL